MNWKEFSGNKKFRVEFFISVVLLISVVTALANFLNFVEARNGFSFNDPILKLYEPLDLTWIIFGLIYISLFAAVISLYKKPDKLVLAFQAYTIMTLFRIIAMYLLPFNPPAKMIPLTDPVVEIFGTGQLLTKDLFFSGHTATIFLLFLLSELKSLKVIFLTSSILVGICVLLQHVHYSIDVFAAPFFAYGSYRLTIKVQRKISPSSS